MILRNKTLFFIFALTMGSATNGLSAHQKKEAVTRVIFNQRTNNIEIIHRFLVHDAEHATKILFGKNADIISDKKSQQQFLRYVIRQFKIDNFTGKQIPLTTVGVEVEGKHIWIYQEAPIPRTESSTKTYIPSSLMITHNTLREIWRQQVNLVNIEYGKKTRSLVFSGSMNSQVIKLD